MFPVLLVLVHFSFAQTRVVTELADGWRFSRGKNELTRRVNFNHKGWPSVAVLHDGVINGPFDKQVVAFMQNREKVTREKTGRIRALSCIGDRW